MTKPTEGQPYTELFFALGSVCYQGLIKNQSILTVNFDYFEHMLR